MTSANTHTEMKPSDKKSWRNTKKIEVFFSMKFGKKEKVFKGFIDLIE